jgi:hypothetical protein
MLICSAIPIMKTPCHGASTIIYSHQKYSLSEIWYIVAYMIETFYGPYLSGILQQRQRPPLNSTLPRPCFPGVCLLRTNLTNTTWTDVVGNSMSYLKGMNSLEIAPNLDQVTRVWRENVVDSWSGTCLCLGIDVCCWERVL